LQAACNLHWAYTIIQAFTPSTRASPIAERSH
jgi:hypothetical protein